MTRTGPNAGTTNYVWDNESRLVSMGGQTTASYTYNGMDARVTASDGQTRTFRRDGVGVTSPVLSDGQATYTPGVSERRAGTSRYLHSGLKNAESRTVSSTAIESVRTYDAFGNVLSTAGSSWSGAFGYAGAFGYQEDPSGLKLLGHRYYDSEIGRFISRDPIGDGRNWYTYCDNNPTRYVDPAGLEPFTLPNSTADLEKMGWERDTKHKDPHGSRWISPNGKEMLEFNQGRAGAPGERASDHWHHRRLDHRGKWTRVVDTHFKPGESLNLEWQYEPDKKNGRRPPPRGARGLPALTALGLVAFLLLWPANNPSAFKNDDIIDCRSTGNPLPSKECNCQYHSNKRRKLAGQG